MTSSEKSPSPPTSDALRVARCVTVAELRSTPTEAFTAEGIVAVRWPSGMDEPIRDAVATAQDTDRDERCFVFGLEHDHDEQED